MVQRLFLEAAPEPVSSPCTYACLYGEAPHGQVVRTSFIHLNLHFRAGERAPAGPPFSSGQMRTCGSSIFGRANAHLRILHFWAGERAPADPPFPGRRTCPCGLSIFGRANAHLQAPRSVVRAGAWRQNEIKKISKTRRKNFLNS